jgi:hypothetical protein
MRFELIARASVWFDPRGSNIVALSGALPGWRMRKARGYQHSGMSDTANRVAVTALIGG